ncbi:hypothetical protein B0O99DRAFT_597978 [Bisporella sp. PMI_857]|nr:hypothetical protein B0O99DRAFT_597978 [Bisporella sp. PMI_857]
MYAKSADLSNCCCFNLSRGHLKYKPTVLKPTVLKPTVLKPTVLKPTVLKPTLLKANDATDINFRLRWCVQNACWPTAEEVPATTKEFFEWFVRVYGEEEYWISARFDSKTGQRNHPCSFKFCNLTDVSNGQCKNEIKEKKAQLKEDIA